MCHPGTADLDQAARLVESRPRPEGAQQVGEPRGQHVQVVGQEEDAEGGEQEPRDDVDGAQVGAGEGEHPGEAAEGHPGHHKGHAQTEGVGDQHGLAPTQGVGVAGQAEDGGQYRADARRPPEGERHPHDRRRPLAEPGRGHVPAPLPHDPGRAQQPGKHQAAGDDDHAGDLVEQLLVRSQGLAQPGRGGLQGGEHHGEAGHEQQGGPQHPALIRAGRRGQLGAADSRHHRQVGRDERQDARR